MKKLLLSLAVALAAASLAAPIASASGGTGTGGNNGCASFPSHSVVANSAVDVTASFTVTNCSSKPKLIDVDLALKDLAGNQIWLTGTGYTQWLSPGQSMSGSFGGLGGLGGIAAGGSYDMQFIARDFTKLEVLTTADSVFTAPAL